MKVLKDTNQRKNDLIVVTVNKVNYIESYKDEFKTLFEDATEEINEEVEYLFILDETSGKDVLINKKHIPFKTVKQTKKLNTQQDFGLGF